MKRLFLALFAISALGAAFAQTKFPLFINCDQMGADLYVNNTLYTQTTPNLKLQLPPGNYNLKFVKPGFAEFATVVSVKATSNGNVLNVVLTPFNRPGPMLLGSSKQIVPSFPLNVVGSVSGAQIYIDGNLVGSVPYQVPIPLGRHHVRVVAPGYSDFVQDVDVNAAVTINAFFQPMQQTLSIVSNVNGASVFLNGNPAGQTPFSAQLPSGTFNVLVRAPGYTDYNQTVVVGNGPSQINALLQPMGYQLNINSNVNGAAVFINGNQMGQTPFIGTMPPGGYSVVVRAPGFQDFQTQVNVNGPQAINATLMPMGATWQIRLPENRDNRDIRGNRAQVWLDGVLQPDAMGQGGQTGQINLGRHTIRIMWNGLTAETQIDVQAGRAYFFEPFLGINVR